MYYDMLSRAIELAAKEHAKQTDKGGTSYILHVLRVMNNLHTTDEELMAIAVLHDVVEDSTDCTFQTLYDMGFSDRVVSAIKLLTKEFGQSYDDYINNICTNKDAMLVKLADLKDNSDLTRLKGLRDKDFARMQKYMCAFKKIQDKLRETF